MSDKIEISLEDGKVPCSGYILRGILMKPEWLTAFEDSSLSKEELEIISEKVRIAGCNHSELCYTWAPTWEEMNTKY